jgi:hypothetical protein
VVLALADSSEFRHHAMRCAWIPCCAPNALTDRRLAFHSATTRAASSRFHDAPRIRATQSLNGTSSLIGTSSSTRTIAGRYDAAKGVVLTRAILDNGHALLPHEWRAAS